MFDQIAELFEDNNNYSEIDCLGVMYQICNGVKYMHSKGIVHRDLKPENILCVKPNSIDKIKIADFGISKMVKCENLKDATFSTKIGTLTYLAPEVLQGKIYNSSVDYWSIGVIMHVLLVGYPPFYGESDQQVCITYISIKY